MLKRRTISDFSESWPQFFKVYLPNQSSHRLRIPPDFVKYITGALPYKSTITSQEKRAWHVELKKVDGHLYLQEGWQQFVHDNSLEFGDFLLFYYGGNAKFNVKIYGKNGCQKKVSRPTREIVREITLPRDNQTVKRRKSKRLAQGANEVEITQKELFPRFSSAIQEGNRAQKEANKFVSEFPFFKVVMYPSYINGKPMRIPPDFVKYVTGALPYKSTITSQEKRAWHVELKKVDGHLYLQEGWQQFVHDNSLEFGDFLQFYYGGNAKFYDKIYGKNSCQKMVSRPTREIVREITHPRDNQAVKRRKSKRLAQGANEVEITQKELFPRFSSAIQEGNRAKKEANKFVSEFPFFKVVMYPSYINGKPMNIPSSFHKRYMEKGRHAAILVASDRSWPVKLGKTAQGGWLFLRGWSAFCWENTLKVDDVCVFELIEKNDFVLKVSIFRCSG